jgi:hypothetical protein
LQKFAKTHLTVLALIPASALSRLGDCLPSTVMETP